MSFENTGEWIEFIGGSSPYREAVRHAFKGADYGSEDSVEILASKLEVNVSVVFSNGEGALGDIERRSSESDRYVIAVVPDLDLIMFHHALLAGASGTVWEDTPTSHLAAVTRAALHGDMLMPAQVVSVLVQHASPITKPAASMDLDPASVRLLHALSTGASIQDLADEMAYSERTIQRKVTNLCLSLGAPTPAAAVHVAHMQGLL